VADGFDSSVSLPHFAVGAAHAWWDLQFAAARKLWQSQNAAAGALDAPDYAAFVHATRQGARDLFAQSAAQMLASLRNAVHMLGAIQRRLTHLAQAQTDEASIGWADSAAMLGDVDAASDGSTLNGTAERSARTAVRTASRTPAAAAPTRSVPRHAAARAPVRKLRKTPRRGARTRH